MFAKVAIAGDNAYQIEVNACGGPVWLEKLKPSHVRIFSQSPSASWKFIWFVKTSLKHETHYLVFQHFSLRTIWLYRFHANSIRLWSF